MASIGNINNRITNGNQITGLASGMDTESMVEKLLSGTQAKIDKQKAEKQQITWKQEIYRDIITKMDNFRTNYFSFFGSGSTNLLSSSFYNTVLTTSSSSAVKVLSSTTKAASNITIDSVSQLASAYMAKSPATVSKELEGEVLGSDLAANTRYAIDITLDGVTKTVNFTTGSTVTADSVAQSLNSSLGTIWGTTLQFESKNGALSIQGNGSTHTVSLSNTKENAENKVDILGKMGFVNGASNKLSYSTPLKHAGFKTALMGDVYRFTINGVSIEASAEDSIGDVISRINSSQAGVKVSYNSIEDRFQMESKATGAISGIDISQEAGNLFSAMFGMGNGSGVASNLTRLRTTDTLTGTAIDPSGPEINEAIRMADFGGQSFKLTVNGEDYVLELPKTAEGSRYENTDGLIDAINEQLDRKFGAGNIKLELGTDNKVSVVSKDGYSVGFDQVDLGADANAKYSLNYVLGLGDEQTQAVIGTTKLTDVGTGGLGGTINIGGTSFSINSDWTMDQLKDAFNAAFGADAMVFDESTGKLSIQGLAGNDIVMEGSDAGGIQTLKTLFGQEHMTFNTTGIVFDEAYAAANGQVGKNAILEVNGTRVERNSNSFEMDGITIQLNGTSSEAISLTTEKDTDKIVEGIKKFVEDYNKLIEELNGYLTEDPNFRSYAPLTDEQKKDLSDREIELWEKKAKEGLLRNDSTISLALSQMRTVLYQTVDSAGLALYQIGLDTSSDYKENGKLILDEDKLKAALSTNLENVQKLFTDPKQGIAVNMSDILKKTANISSGSPGLLVSYAGTSSALKGENTLSKQLASIEDRISQLNKKYEIERQRYWKQFTAMEQAISNMNSQSSWISQQFSS